jgi:hypothetical protein
LECGEWNRHGVRPGFDGFSSSVKILFNKFRFLSRKISVKSTDLSVAEALGQVFPYLAGDMMSLLKMVVDRSSQRIILALSTSPDLEGLMVFPCFLFTFNRILCLVSGISIRLTVYYLRRTSFPLYR